jgi:DNA helicase-2/ATP-dependent DNA helicase PcrA
MGREYRALLDGARTEGLSERIAAHMATTWKIEAVPVSPAQMDGSAGEVKPGSGILKYDRTLSPSDALALFAHELGHLALHKRLTDPSAPRDPVLGSAYADAGPGAVARYSPRAMEEAQATAFATEFLCPSEELFLAWRANRMSNSTSLAADFGAPIRTVQAQLAHALHEFALGASTAPITTPREITLTPNQHEAASFIGRPALVDAGPGTGKTATLIGRIQILLEAHGARSEQMLVLTFSNEAAQELHERVRLAFGAAAADEMTIATFHGFGMSFLHHHGHHVGYETDFAVMDEDAQAELVSSTLGRAPCLRLIVLRDPRETVEAIVQHINFCKHRLLGVEQLAQALNAWEPSSEEADARAIAEEFLGLYREYESSKHASKRIDLADLIMLPLRVLESQPDVVAAYRAKYPWVLVDEFQDVTRATARLLQQLCGAENPPWVVGDARQAIYRFLGAAPENVREFKTDFPNASVFELVENYRSSAPVVQAANELATLMADPTATAGDVHQRWRPATSRAPLGTRPVIIAEASSDYAEHEGIADHVKAWLETGDMTPGDIAVLARRNVDVRNVVLALGARGVRAQASGLLTAEGPAGDLAAAVTLIDAPAASIPRLGIALSRGRFSIATANSAVSHMVSTLGADGSFDLAAPDDGADIAVELAAAHARLEQERDSGDGFSTLAAFLFDCGGYLRRLCDSPDTAERAMALVEVVSALSIAAGYRMTHPDVSPRVARVGFAEHLRAQLTKSAPIPIAPRARADAVRVMTCHASKGLEFPCVIVAGQTMPRPRARYPWLPPAWRPTGDEDVEQADALFFVGLTRAQRAVVVSYPKQAGEGGRAPAKLIVQLLARWRDVHARDGLTWSASGGAAVEVVAGPVWGGRPPVALSLAALDPTSCAIRTYLESYLGMSFPVASRPLYPAFFAVTRRVVRQLVRRANEGGAAISEAEVRAAVNDAWPAADFVGHPHEGIYRDAVFRMALGFAAAYQAPAGPVELLDAALAIAAESGEPLVRMDLIGHFRQADGQVVTISFRPESLRGKTSKGVLNWSAVSSNKRMGHALVEQHTPGTHPRIFSGEDGEVYEYKWSRDKNSLPKEIDRVLGQLESYSRSEFTTTISPYACDRCRVRVSCPYWTGALD